MGTACPQSKAYRAYNPMSGKVIVSRNLTFDENKCWSWDKSTTSQVSVDINDATDIQESTLAVSQASSPISLHQHLPTLSPPVMNQKNLPEGLDHLMTFTP